MGLILAGGSTPIGAIAFLPCATFSWSLAKTLTPGRSHWACKEHWGRNNEENIFAPPPPPHNLKTRTALKRASHSNKDALFSRCRIDYKQWETLPSLTHFCYRAVDTKLLGRIKHWLCYGLAAFPCMLPRMQSWCWKRKQKANVCGAPQKMNWFPHPRNTCEFINKNIAQLTSIPTNFTLSSKSLSLKVDIIEVTR